MSKNNIDLEFKSNIENRLRRIANVLMLNAGHIDNPGLFNGKMGISIFFYLYGRYTGNEVFSDYAGELIDEIYEEINTNTPVDFQNGLSGIGWGIEYLVENKFVDADTDEALSEIDNAIYRNIYSNPVLLDNGDDLFGYGLYFVSRLRGYENDDDNLNTLIKKEHLIYLTDECERLLVFKRYLEFNILQLSVATVNSLLWFLLEIQRLGLFPSKVKKIMKYLPDYISIGQQVHNSFSEWHVLQNLTRKAVNQIDDDSLKLIYKSLYERAVNELKNRNDDDKSLLENLQSFQLQKLIYGKYMNGTAMNYKQFKMAFGFMDNEENWSGWVKEISKTDLGLTGLAGTGLLLLKAINPSHAFSKYDFRQVRTKNSAVPAKPKK